MRKVDLEKHEEKRRQILDAAEWCFARDGFQGASTSDICARAKISPGHLYHYFASKEAIVGAIIEARLEHVAARFSEMMQSAKPVETLVREIERARWRKRGAGQHLLLDMLAEAGRNPAMAKIVSAQSKKLHGFVADFLRDAQTRGQVDGSLDADVAASILISIIDGARTLTIRDPTLDMAKTLDVLKILITRFLTQP